MSSANLLSDPQDLLVLDYREVRETDADCSVGLVATRSGTAHGLHLWFDAELAPNIGFSNAPGEPEQIYGQNFFPLAQPVDLAPGDCIEVQMTARLIDGSYVWNWNSSVMPVGSSEPERRFRQSSFGAKVMSPKSLQRHSSTFIPTASKDHMVDGYCLSLIDGRHSLGEIAEQIHARFPARFKTLGEALNHVVHLANRYS